MKVVQISYILFYLTHLSFCIAVQEKIKIIHNSLKVNL